MSIVIIVIYYHNHNHYHHWYDHLQSGDNRDIHHRAPLLVRPLLAVKLKQVALIRPDIGFHGSRVKKNISIHLLRLSSSVMLSSSSILTACFRGGESKLTCFFMYLLWGGTSLIVYQAFYLFITVMIQVVLNICLLIYYYLQEYPDKS